MSLPFSFKEIAARGFSAMVTREAARAQQRVWQLELSAPHEDARQRAWRLIEAKKQLAGVLGGFSGTMGFAAIPTEYVYMNYLQLSLLIDIAIAHGVNFGAARAKRELRELFGYVSGIHPVARAGPALARGVGRAFLRSGLWARVGQSIPLLAMPLTARLQSQHLHRVGEEAILYYSGFQKVRPAE
jgi:hypothetical protein